MTLQDVTVARARVEEARAAYVQTVRQACAELPVARVAAELGVTRARVYQMIEPTREELVARVEEFDRRWSLIVDEAAAFFKPPPEVVKWETAKRNPVRAKAVRNGRGAGPETVLGEIRRVAEEQLLKTLERFPEDRTVRAIVAEHEQARKLREKLDKLENRTLREET